MVGKGKYLIGDRAPVRGRKERSFVTRSEHQITADTPLVSVDDCSRLLAENRGWNLSPTSIRRRCTGEWRDRRGEIWVKPGKQYLLNMSAIYAAIAGR